MIMANYQLLLKTCIVVGFLLLVISVDYGESGHYAKKKKVVIHVPVHKKIQKHVHMIVKHVHHHHKPIVIKDEKIIHEQHIPVIKKEHISHEHMHHHHEKHEHHQIHMPKEEPEIEEEHIHHHHNYEHKVNDHNDSFESEEGFE